MTAEKKHVYTNIKRQRSNVFMNHKILKKKIVEQQVIHI